MFAWALWLFAWGAPAAALPLQDLSRTARGAVAHLSVRNGKGEEISTGSGFVISAGGRLVTNFHVIDGAEDVVAVFPGKREARVTGVWSFDKKVDIAILQLQPGAYERLPLATDPAREGEEIAVIGSPLGLGNAITAGLVSAVRERGLQDTPFGKYDEDVASWALQITAAAAPGSSGSPILRGNGEVVGVLVGNLRPLEGVHFGIAVAKVQSLLSAAVHAEPLNSATGARSVRTNLLISALFFAGLGLVWVVGGYVQRRFRARPRLGQH